MESAGRILIAPRGGSRKLGSGSRGGVNRGGGDALTTARVETLILIELSS